jgi:adenylate cyclase
MLLGFITLSHQSSLMQSQMNQFGQSIARIFAESAREPLLAEDSISLSTLTRKLGNTRSALGAAIYSEVSDLVVSHGIVPERKIDQLYQNSQALNDYEYNLKWLHTHSDGASEEMSSYITPIRYKNIVAGHVLVTFSRRHIQENFRQSMQTLGFVVFLMLVLAIVIAIVMSRRITRPVQELLDASIAIGEGDYHVRLKDKRHDEVGLLMSAFNDMAHGLLKKSQVEQALSRYVSSNVAKQILNNLERVELGGTHVNATVLFADIVGFTQIAEESSPQEVSHILNEYFGMITEASTVYKGTIDKFIGDCAMIVFGVPEHDSEQHFHAVACGVLIQRLTLELNKNRLAQNKRPIEFRIGINAGHMLAGNMGAPDRMQYTVVGDAVNLASRLSTVAGPGEILIQESLYDQLTVHTRVIAHKQGELTVRGKSDPIYTYVVEDLSIDYQLQLDDHISKILKNHFQ